MAVSTNPNSGGCVIQLTSHLSDVENYWGCQGYSPFQFKLMIGNHLVSRDLNLHFEIQEVYSKLKGLLLIMEVFMSNDVIKSFEQELLCLFAGVFLCQSFDE